ncbi:MAG: magnesium transporter, partial [Symbiobacteriaceae bacterium]|nr:magnesium transporter [Symbiobacteriaceae bacterium]
PLQLQLRLLYLLGPMRAGDILDDLPDKMKLDILNAVDVEQRQRLISMMASDEIADFLAGLGSEKKKQFISEMDAADAREMQELLTYPSDSAGGLMITEFVAYPREMTVGEVLDRLPGEVDNTEMIYYIYVVMEDGRLAGVVSLRQLVIASPEQQLMDIATTEILKARLNSPQAEVVEILTHYDLLAIPVVDNNSVLRGIVTYDSIADIISGEATEEVFSFVGVQASDEDIEWHLTPWLRAKRRLPWLLICIIGGILSGQVISQFTDALMVVVSLSFFIPIQMDTAGNVATQSVAITVRGLATGDLDGSRILRLAVREAFIGASMGLVCGIVLALSAFIIWGESMRLGLAIGLSMAISLVISAVLGTVLPLLSFRYKVDPAVTSGPLATTTLDIIGLTIYFVCVVSILGLNI